MVWLLTGFLSTVGGQQQPATGRLPNVVVFLSDDAGWGDFSFHGNQQIETPNIDAIARQGAQLEHFYVCPVCSPTRAEFLTGRYHLRGGVIGVSTGQERLDLDERTIAESFQRAGYASGVFGKWHNGSQWPYHPLARGFDEYYGHPAGHWGEYFDPELELNGRMVREQGYIVDVCTSRAIEFIERNAARPFFCYIPFTTPHTPWAVPEQDWQRYKDKPIQQRASEPQREKLEETRCALAMVDNQDQNVGRVLQTLDSLGLTDETIVVFFSDNGPNSWRFNGGMRGKKGSTDEGGVRSPGWIRWPGKIAAGVNVERISGAIDLLPTLVGLVGIERVGDKPLDGQDLSPWLLGQREADEAAQAEERMIFSSWVGRTSVRTQRYRLDHQGRLYDMSEDPGQREDISDDRPEVAQRLRQAVEDWNQEMMDEAAAKGVDLSDRQAMRGQVDPRPLHVGFAEFPSTILPARDGTPQGGVARSARAPNSSYFVDWTSPDDRILWNVEVKTPGTYEVVIDYTCPLDDAGSLVELSFGEATLQGRVDPGWDPPLYDNQDTLPRPPAESMMKPFGKLALGAIELDSGAGPLTLRAIEIPGNSVMDVRRVTLTLRSAR